MRRETTVSSYQLSPARRCRLVGGDGDGDGPTARAFARVSGCWRAHGQLPFGRDLHDASASSRMAIAGVDGGRPAMTLSGVWKSHSDMIWRATQSRETACSEASSTFEDLWGGRLIDILMACAPGR